MPSLNEVIDQITAPAVGGNIVGPDAIRQNYLEALHQLTGRNLICYYSGWLNTGDARASNLSIEDMDKNGFMNAIAGMDCSIGLDLVLHTPGGSITAAESLVYYIRTKFNSDVRVIIPQMAMSAGTMIACSAKKILMGNQSCIGPFDPFVKGVSAFAVFEEFARASKNIKKQPHNIPLWQTMIGKYPPAFLEECDKAIQLANSIVPQWLSSGMFEDLDEAEKNTKIGDIMSHLNSPSTTKEHSRHIHADKADSLGLEVEMLEDDQQLQDAVLTLHHAYMATLLMTNTSKLIESHHGKRLIIGYQDNGSQS